MPSTLAAGHARVAPQAEGTVELERLLFAPDASPLLLLLLRWPAFGLGDYEWILAFEADELHRIVDLMRELRASRARRHVREEIPFFTGRSHSVAELLSLWP